MLQTVSLEAEVGEVTMGGEPGGVMAQLDAAGILRALPDPLIVADRTGTIVFAGPAIEPLLGWPAAQLQGRSLSLIQPERFQPSHQIAFQRFVQAAQPVPPESSLRVPALRRDGTEVEVELTLSTLRERNGELLVLGIMRAVQEPAEIERRLALTSHLRASAAAATRMTSLLDFDAVLDTVISTLVKDFGAALARVWLAEPVSGSLYLRAEGGGLPAPRGVQAEQLHYQALPFWLDEVVRSREPLLSNDPVHDQRFDTEWTARHNVRGVAALPLLTGDRLRGVMVLYARYTFSAALMDVLAGFAAIVAASLNDVQLLVREQEARADAEEAQHRFAYLAEASRVLAASLDHETTLASVARLVVPHLADWCIIDVVDADDTIRRLAVAHVNPERQQMARDLQERYPPAPDRDRTVERVIRTGEPVLIRRIAPEAIDAMEGEDEYRNLLRGLGLRSFMCIPMVAHGRVRGAISLISAESDILYGERDLALAEDLARRAAIAVDNARLYQELQEAVQMRDEFLSSVSHDLKNPLAGIRGRAQMLQRRLDQLPEDERGRFAQGLAGIDGGVSRMTRLIDDLVDVARLRMGQPIDLLRTPTDLVELLRQVILDQESRDEKHHIVLRAAAESIKGLWDAARLERVFANLLSNAVKYSPAEREIEIETWTEQRGGRQIATVLVCDQGIGIPAADLPNIFQRFYRAQNTGTVEGSGIGLAGTKHLVERHGGTIAIDSQEGQGTTVRVELPLAPAEGQPA